MRFIPSVSIGILLFTSACGSAFAHATPVEYAPQAAAILGAAPLQIRIRFSERIEPLASSMTIYAPDGSRIANTQATVSTADAHMYSMENSATGSGTYTVSWQVVSRDDGHFTKGAFSFSIGKETGEGAASGFQILHRTTIPQGFSIFLELLGQALLLGSLALFLFLPIRIHHRWRTLTLCACGLIVLGTGLYIALESMNLSSADSPFAVSLTNFLHTTTGSYALYRMIAGIIFGISFLISPLSAAAERGPGGEDSTRKAAWLLIGFVMVMALLRARVSHAAASEFLPTLSVLINAVHLLGKELWIGSVAAFVLLYLPVLWKRNSLHELTQSLIALSTLATTALLIGGTTGVYIVWLHLKDFSNVFTTQWGMLFFSLTGLAILFLGLRLYQQWFVLPSFVRTTNGKGTDEDRLAVQSSWMLLIAELWTGLAVLATSSLLIITTPPLAQNTRFTSSAESQDVSLTLEQHPYETGMLRIIAKTPQNNPLKSIVVTLTNTEKGIGPIVADMTERFPGGYVFPVSALSPSGTWKIDVTATKTQGYDAVATFTVDTLRDLSMPGPRRNWGYICTMLIAAISIILLFLLLSAQNKRLRALLSQNVLPLPDGTRVGPKAMLVSSALCILVLFAMQSQVFGHTHSGFAQLCEKNGHMWHESVPMRSGKVTASRATLGCMTGSGKGQFHFSDAREYLYFMRPVSAIAHLYMPDSIQAGKPVPLSVSIQDSSGAAVTELAANHDRLLHAVVIGRDLTTFSHIHPDDLGPVTEEMIRTATFPLQYTFPKAGRYLLATDFAIRGKEFSQTFFVTVEGGQPMDSADIVPDRTFENGGYTIQLSAPNSVWSKRQTKLLFHMEKDGKPVTDLQPYLAAASHISVAKGDLLSFQHAHGEVPLPVIDALFTRRNVNAKHTHTLLPDRFGPDIQTYVTFPSPGTYVIFAQFKHGKELIPARFVVEVR